MVLTGMEKFIVVVLISLTIAMVIVPMLIRLGYVH